MENKDILNETRGEYVLRMLKEQRAQQQNIVTFEDIHREVINLAQFVYKYRTPDLAFKEEVYHALSQLNIKLLTYREKH